MICFSLEVKYGTLFEDVVGFQENRIAARGNATSFALPWRDIMTHLKRTEMGNAAGVSPDVPHSPAELASVVQVLLKVSDAKTKDNFPKFIEFGDAWSANSFCT